MSKKQYIDHIDKELSRINEQIDLKIIRGLGYKEEARKHRELLFRMSVLKRSGFMHNMQGILGAMATFIF